MLPSWERTHRETLLDTRFMKVYEDTVRLPNGNVIDDYTVVTLPSGVIIVATDTEGRLLSQYEYKYAVDKTILNLPSGSVEEGVSVIDTAKKELLEETGYEATEVELVSTLYEYPSKADHLIHIVRAKNVQKVADVQHEQTESISEVVLLTPETRRDAGVFDTTYAVSALALTLPKYLQN